MEYFRFLYLEHKEESLGGNGFELLSQLVSFDSLSSYSTCCLDKTYFYRTIIYSSANDVSIPGKLLYYSRWEIYIFQLRVP